MEFVDLYDYVSPTMLCDVHLTSLETRNLYLGIKECSQIVEIIHIPVARRQAVLLSDVLAVSLNTLAYAYSSSRVTPTVFFFPHRPVVQFSHRARQFKNHCTAAM
jgi:hypothetical protein